MSVVISKYYIYTNDRSTGSLARLSTKAQVSAFPRPAQRALTHVENIPLRWVEIETRHPLSYKRFDNDRQGLFRNHFTPTAAGGLSRYGSTLGVPERDARILRHFVDGRHSKLQKN